MELDNKVHNKIVILCEHGDGLMENGHFDKAIEKYSDALALVPHPKTRWCASTWIYAALGDACFFAGEYKRAVNYFYDALNCPEGMNNPFISLRLGQCLSECGEINKAKEFLLKAYMLKGMDIFKDEDERYFELVKQII